MLRGGSTGHLRTSCTSQPGGRTAHDVALSALNDDLELHGRELAEEVDKGYFEYSSISSSLNPVVNTLPFVNSQNADFISPDGINDPVITYANPVSLISVLDLLVRLSEGIVGEQSELFDDSLLSCSIESVESLLSLPAEKNLVGHSSGNLSPLSISASISSSSFSFLTELF